MSTVSANTILDATGGNSATINGATPTVYNTMGKNRIINGAMEIDQRNAGASVAASNASTVTYTLDRWPYYADVSSKFTVQQNAGSVTPPVGFVNYLGVTSSSAYSVGASERFVIQHRIEGLNIADLAWGTASAKTITISFWIRSSLTGTFGGALRNSAANRSYPFTYTISSANTWEQKSITIAGDTTGTWLTTNGSGIIISIGLGVGSTYSGTAGSWVAGNYQSATGATSVVGTNGATLYITGVQLEAGSVATEFERRPYGTELALCYRYYQYYNNSERVPAWVGPGTSTHVLTANVLKVPMRAAPTVSLSGAASFDAYFSSTYTQSSAGIIRNTGSTDCVVLIYPNFTGLPSNAAGAITIATTSISAEL